MSTLRIAFAATALTLLAPLAAQLRPMPGMPMVPPPVPHPALGAQPWFNNPGGDRSTSTPESEPAAPAANGAMPGNKPKPAAPPEETMGAKLEGKELKKAVVKVNKSLKWFDNLQDARAQSAATGKPILWLQALGDIDGFA